jgi:hypothetical protein
MTGQATDTNPSAGPSRVWLASAVVAEVVWLLFLVWMAWQA